MITDKELIETFDWWLNHYTKNGDKHYDDTPDWKVIELYYDLIVDRVLESLPMMSDEENEIIVERLNSLV